MPDMSTRGPSRGRDSGSDSGPRTYRLVAPSLPDGGSALVPDVAQRAVIDHDSGPLLVLAGPGTGKTATLVEAVVDRISRRDADPESVLVLTFSRRAAGELRERITGRLRRTTREPLARTFHSYAFGLLRAASGSGVAPRLLAGSEQDLLIRELLAGDASTGAGEWPAPLRPALRLRGFASELRDIVLRAEERGLGPAELDTLGRRTGRPQWRAAASFLQEYADVTALSGSSAYDPAELIRAALGSLRADPALLEAERRRRRWIFVDEYQDTDPAQEELLAILAAGARELVVVGDPDQSIYGFRGADPTAIRRFPERFAAPDGQPAPTVALAVCRRSGPALLAASRRVAARLRGPVAHRHLTSAWRTPAARVCVAALRSPAEEAAYIAARLREAHLVDGVAWQDMAVLVRSTARSLPLLRRALVSAEIPVEVAAGDLPLAAAPALAPLLRVLHTIRDPAGVAALDESAVAELLCSPYGGADTLSLRRLQRALRIHRDADAVAGAGADTDVDAGPATVADRGPHPGVPEIGDPSGRRRAPGPLARAVADPGALEGLPGHDARPARRIADLVAAGRAAVAEGAGVEAVLWSVWERCGVAAAWERASRDGGPTGAFADRDLDAVVALFDSAARYVDRTPAGTLEGFLDYLLGQEIPGDTLAPRAQQRDAVRVLTAHASKGLQWTVVAVAGVQEGVWPDLRRRGSVLGAEDLVDEMAGYSADAATPEAVLDEERRLFYVAVTRATRSLVVTASRDGAAVPSRFLDELDPLTPGVQERPYADLPRAMSVPALIAELRTVVTDPGETRRRREAAAGQLARLAAAGFATADPAHWWGLPALSDPGALSPPEDPVVVSPSKVDTFDRCELRWLLSSVGADRSVGVKQSIGTLLHTMAEAISTGRRSEAEARADFAAGLSEIDLGPQWLARQRRENALTMAAKLIGWLAARPAGTEFLGAEVEVDVPIGAGAIVRGRVDRLERDASGRIVVVDFKTGSSAPTKAEVPRHAQLGVYQAAVEAGGFARWGEESGGATLVQLGSRARTREDKQPPLSDDPDPKWARELVERAARGMGGTVFNAIPGVLCGSCVLKATCPAQVEGLQVTEGRSR